MGSSVRRYLLLAWMAVMLGAMTWSIALVTDPANDQSTRSYALVGVGLFAILAGRACAHLLKPWLASRPASDTTRLTR
jgi:hypothetical protein